MNLWDGLVVVFSFLGGGSLVASALGWWFDRLSQERHFRQTIEDKMVERIAALNETYHVHVWRSGKQLSTWLLATHPTHSDELRLYFWALAAYLHHADRLQQERPEPLLFDLDQGHLYLHKMSEISRNLPFDPYQVSVFLEQYRGTGPRPLSPHRFIDRIASEPSLATLFAAFEAWYEECRCRDEPASPCRRHVVARACLVLSGILAEQNHELYSRWRRRRSGRRHGPGPKGFRKRLSAWLGRPVSSNAARRLDID